MGYCMFLGNFVQIHQQPILYWLTPTKFFLKSPISCFFTHKMLWASSGVSGLLELLNDLLWISCCNFLVNFGWIPRKPHISWGNIHEKPPKFSVFYFLAHKILLGVIQHRRAYQDTQRVRCGWVGVIFQETLIRSPSSPTFHVLTPIKNYKNCLFPIRWLMKCYCASSSDVFPARTLGSS